MSDGVTGYGGRGENILLKDNEMEVVIEDLRNQLDAIVEEINSYAGVEGEEKKVESMIEEFQRSVNSVTVEGYDEQRFVEDILERKDQTPDDLRKLLQDKKNEYLEFKNKYDSGDYLVVKESEGTFLRPGKSFRKIEPGRGGFQSPREKERLMFLLKFLDEWGFSRKDVIIRECEDEDDLEGTMREKPYILVEIPSIDRQILVCNQVGQITFVIQGILNREIFKQFRKDEFQEEYSDRVRTVRDSNRDQWEEGLFTYLFNEVEDVGGIKKVDVNKQERMRNIVMKLVPTPEDWTKLGHDPKVNLSKELVRICEVGLDAMATIFQVDGSPVIYRVPFLLLGQKIYGYCEALKVWKLEELVEIVKKLVTTEDEWNSYNVPQRFALHDLLFEKTRIGLRKFATMMGVKPRVDIYKNKYYLELGKRVYAFEAPSSTSQ
jgi:hypothetical protein